METAIGAFDSSRRARQAIDLLGELGYDEGRLGFARLAGPDEIRDPEASPDPESVAQEAAEGAVGGAAGGVLAGAGTGLLASAGVVTVPGLGPLLAAGTLAAGIGAAATGGVAGAALGGVAGAIWGAAAEEAPDPDEAVDGGLSLYRRVVGAGGSVVTVDVPDGHGHGMALQLEQFGARATSVYAGPDQASSRSGGSSRSGR